MYKCIIYYGFLCAVSLILVSGLPTKKENEIDNNAIFQNDESSDILTYNSAADSQSRKTREAAPQRFHGGGRRGGGSGAQAGSFAFGGGRRGGISGSGAQASSFGRGRGRGGSNAQSESFNFNTPFGQFSGSEASANSFGRRG